MTEQEILEKIEDARLDRERALKEWLDSDYTQSAVRRRVLISADRRLAALKSNYNRWYVSKTPHKHVWRD
jgi:hypothetical protein